MTDTILFVMRDDGDMTEPMNIMLLSALAMRDRPFRTDLAVLERDDITNVVRRKKPDVVAFSAITGSHQALLDANRKIKAADPAIKTVIGGPFATFRPGIVHEHDFDAVGVGECDDAWPELLDRWSAGRPFDDVPNIVTKENASRVLRKTLDGGHGWTIRSEHLLPRKTKLDTLPFMDRDLIYANTVFKTRYKRTMMAGRGCPFRCTYCFEHVWNGMYEGKGRILQRYSVARLCAELKELKNRWDTRFIKFYDDVFPVFDRMDDDWLEEFAETYPREIGLPFHCLVRAELVNERHARKLRLLKKAGIASISMSIEAGNAFARDYVLIRDMAEKDLRNAFAICRRLKIHTFANTILAVPVPTLPNMMAPDAQYETQLKRVLTVAGEVDPKRKSPYKKLNELVHEARMGGANEKAGRIAVDAILREAGVRENAIDYDKESVRFNAKLHVSFGEFPVFFPYQGTQLGEYAVRRRYFDGDYDKLHASYQTKSPLTGFSEREKLQQQNLALLGTVALLFAGSFHPIMNLLAMPFTKLATDVLASLPLTGLYVRMYSAAKNYMHASRIYPMRFSPRERFRYFWDNYALDSFKQEGMARRDERPGQTLGGTPSV